MLGTLAIVALAALLLWRVRSKIARRNAAAGSPRERLDDIARRAAARDEIQAAAAEMVETSRRIAAQLDAKARRLETLIERADARLARLDSAGPPAPPPAVVANGHATRRRRSISPATAEHAENDDHAAATAVRAPIERDHHHDRTPEGEASPDGDRDPLTARVYDLADRGEEPVAIARALGEATGKVELILALRRSVGRTGV